tara:strand:- start:1063 stop:2994 length:1932 start_codon:yes stop_codon:yes gene_type:complete
MGFNFGAFAAGAIKGAGDLMEEQNKDTKDKIDKNMTFAYQQGLPFHRDRQKKLRKLKGYASDITNLGLTPDEVNKVMSGSEASIELFISSSIAEIKRRPNGTFDPSTQVSLPDGGLKTNWEDVQMGVINKPSINRPTQPARKSIFGGMMGSNSSSNEGFNRLTSRAEQEMSSITGVGYDDVSAAAQGAYSYSDPSEGTINLIDSSASTQAEIQNLQWENMQKLGSTTVDYQIWQFSNAKTNQERQDLEWGLKEKQIALEKIILTDRIESNVDKLTLDNKLAQIRSDTLNRKYGTTPQKGLYITQHAILEESLKPEPNKEKINQLIETRTFLETAVAEQNALEQNSSTQIAYAQYNASLEQSATRILEASISEDGYWNPGENGMIFDMSKTNASIFRTAARKSAATKMIANLRASKQPISNHLKNFFSINSDLFGGLPEELLKLPSVPEDESKIVGDQKYVLKVPAQPPKGGVAQRDNNGDITGFSVATAAGAVVIPRVYEYRIFDGSDVIKNIENKKLSVSRNQEMQTRFKDNQPVFGGSVYANQNKDDIPDGVNAAFIASKPQRDQEKRFIALAKINNAKLKPQDKNTIDSIHNKLADQFNNGTYDPETVQEEISYLLANGVNVRRLMVALEWQKSLSASVQ